jgi:hypothetical protein
MRERYCCVCGNVFDAVCEDDFYCKRCLLVAYDLLRTKIGELESTIAQSPIATSNAAPYTVFEAGEIIKRIAIWGITCNDVVCGECPLDGVGDTCYLDCIREVCGVINHAIKCREGSNAAPED